MYRIASRYQYHNANVAFLFLGQIQNLKILYAPRQAMLALRVYNFHCTQSTNVS